MKRHLQYNLARIYLGAFNIMGQRKMGEMKVIYGGNQMSLIRDTEEILKFLEFVGRKSILSKQAIDCRLTACNNLFSVLNEDEDNIDYILKNLDLLTNRFRNKNNSVQASTLKVYKSRVKSSLEDFKSWSADPFVWERAVTDKARAHGLERRNQKAKAPKVAAPTATAKPTRRAAKAETQLPETPATVEIPIAADGRGRRVQFPIRPDFSVEMVLPQEGISLKDLHRIGLFLYPYCNDIDPETLRWPSLPH